MIGPHHSIMRRFTSIGQGAAAWIATRCEERSYFRLTASGSLSMRTNMVGTHWLWVTRCSRISCKAHSASKCSITTAVPPKRITVMQCTSGAEW